MDIMQVVAYTLDDFETPGCGRKTAARFSSSRLLIPLWLRAAVSDQRGHRFQPDNTRQRTHLPLLIFPQPRQQRLRRDLYLLDLAGAERGLLARRRTPLMD